MKNYITALLVFTCHCAIAQHKPEIGGSIEYDHFRYFEQADNKINGRSEGTFILALSSAQRSQVKWLSEVEIRNDLYDENRRRVQLQEMYFSVPMGKFDLSAGKRILNWGTTEGVSPLNCINPTDYSDILDTEEQEIGEYMVKADFFHKDFTAELLYIPVTQYSSMPSMNSRWFPELATEAPHPLVPSQTLPINYSYKRKVQDSGSPESDFAMKVKYFFKGIDISAIYFNGYANTPVNEIADFRVSSDEYYAEIHEYTYRVQITGIGIERFFGSTGFKVESAYHIPDADSIISSQVNAEYLHSVVSVERIFSGGELIKNIHPILLYSNESPLNGGEFHERDLQHIFQNAAVGKVSFGIGENIELETTGLYSFEEDDYYVNGVCTYSLSDGAECSISATMLGGDREGFFGSYDHNDRISVGFSYEF